MSISGELTPTHFPPIATSPQSGALSVYMSMGAGGCSVGTLTFSNFSYEYTQIAGTTDTTPGTTTTIAPSNFNLSPYTGLNGTGRRGRAAGGQLFPQLLQRPNQ